MLDHTGVFSSSFMNVRTVGIQNLNLTVTEFFQFLIRDCLFGNLIQLNELFCFILCEDPCPAFGFKILDPDLVFEVNRAGHSCVFCCSFIDVGAVLVQNLDFAVAHLKQIRSGGLLHLLYKSVPSLPRQCP